MPRDYFKKSFGARLAEHEEANKEVAPVSGIRITNGFPYFFESEGEANEPENDEDNYSERTER